MEAERNSKVGYRKPGGWVYYMHKMLVPHEYTYQHGNKYTIVK